jgi:phosphoglycolate phosphatase (TIGR01487 family)
MDAPVPPADAPPLVADIDGTLTDDSRGVDPRVFPVIRSWPSPVVIATGKAMPYPVALCEFLAIPVSVVAENGGVVVAGRDTVRIEGDREAADAVAAGYRAEGYDLGWGGADLPNRWRETELAVSRESPLEPLERIAADHGLDVVDTGFAYHVKSAAIDKGVGLRAICTELGLDPETFLAVGDSENDVATFEAAGVSVAVANADEAALAAADHVTEGAYGDGFLEAVELARTD